MVPERMAAYMTTWQHVLASVTKSDAPDYMAAMGALWVALPSTLSSIECYYSTDDPVHSYKPYVAETPFENIEIYLARHDCSMHCSFTHPHAAPMLAKQLTSL